MKASTFVTRCNGDRKRKKTDGRDDDGVGAVGVMMEKGKKSSMGRYTSDDWILSKKKNINKNKIK